MNRKLNTVILLLFFASLFISCGGENGSTDYRYSVEIVRKQNIYNAGEWNSIDLNVTNRGKIPWIISSENMEWRVRLSYHLWNEDCSRLLSEGIRSDFEQTVRPGSTVKIRFNFILPRKPGKHILVIDLLKESHFWFKDIGNKPLTIEINSINPLKDYQEMILTGNEFRNFDKFLHKNKNNRSLLRIFTYYSEVNKSAKIIMRTFDINYYNNHSPVSGYFPGSIYRQIWLRDNYYHALSGIFLFTPERTRSIAETFLEFYAKHHFVPDYITPDGEYQRYTAATDNPAFLLLIASEYLLQTGDYNWLKKHIINKTSVYDILEQLEGNEFREVFDRKHGLFFSAHTADWGDVEFEDSSEEAQQMGRNSHKVAGIYTQSLYHYAINRWADVLYRVRLYQRSMELRFKGDKLRARTNETLWKPDLGFYKIHKHITPLVHDFAEDAIFALGGNIWAVKSGLADKNKSSRILDRIEYLKTKYNYPTVSKVLIPPYPAGFFRHFTLSMEDRYQNGGFWDWYGAIVVLEEFKSGKYRRAMEHLREITKLIETNNNLYEWYDAQGRGQGSPHYLASGSSVLDALMFGYFGIRYDSAGWSISPAYDTSERGVIFRKPEIGLSIIYKIKPYTKQRRVEIDYYINGQDKFTWIVPLIKIEKKKMKRVRKPDTGKYFYDKSNQFLYYKTNRKPGKGKLVIRY